MKNNQEILSSILKTTQMGQTGIRSVLKTSVSPSLEQALRSQLKEYDSIEDQAHKIAKKNHWKVPELHPGVRAMADMTTRMKLAYRKNDSRIAAMMVQGNTRGVIKGLKNAHHSVNKKPEVAELSQKLLDCEKENIRQMEPFL